jgi:hypothetical protein
VVTARQAELAPGEEMLVRYRGPAGEVHGAFPVRVVEDSGSRIVVWLAPRTPVMYYAAPDGGDARDLPLEERFRRPFSSVRRDWHGSGVLRVIPLRETYQVVHFWDDAGDFVGWYVNLESPKTVAARKIDAVDWQLDLWIDPDGTPSWKDEDEAAAAVTAGYLRPEELAVAQATGRAIVERFDAWLADLGDWRTWRPPATWDPPPLPDDWADTP